MAKRIEFDAPGGTDVLVYRDFTPADPARVKFRWKTKQSV